MAGCADCGLEYGDDGFPDLIIPLWAWEKISPTRDEGGLLCPNCINRRLVEYPIQCAGAFMSGNIISVSETEMNNLRRIENIERRLQQEE